MKILYNEKKSYENKTNKDEEYLSFVNIDMDQNYWNIQKKDREEVQYHRYVLQHCPLFL